MIDFKFGMSESLDSEVLARASGCEFKQMKQNLFVVEWMGSTAIFEYYLQ